MACAAKRAGEQTCSGHRRSSSLRMEEEPEEWHPTLFPAWIDVCHDLEAAEAIDRSLSRGRTVNVTTDEPTEEEAFKGVMAAGGCLTLAIRRWGCFYS